MGSLKARPEQTTLRSQERADWPVSHAHTRGGWRRAVLLNSMFKFPSAQSRELTIRTFRDKAAH